MSTIQTPVLDGIQNWSIDDKIASFERDGVLAKFFAFSEHVDCWTTRLTKPAYRRGWYAGLRGESDSPPYRRIPSNFQTGGNNPFRAWAHGWCDGERVRRILVDPLSVVGIQHREWKLLPSSMRERALAGANARYAAEHEGGSAR